MTQTQLAHASKLWIDQPDALQSVAAHDFSEQTARHLTQYIERGYTVFERAITPQAADAIVSEAHALAQRSADYVAKRKGKYADPATMQQLSVGDRVLDLYAISEAAREAVFAPPVADFLHAVFGEPAIAMQELYFEFGSQQAIHQDTAYVVAREPLHLAASWIALEDVEPGTGELVYYPGSHRFTPYLFGGTSKSWNKGRDGVDTHRAFLAQLHEQARARGLEIERFLPRKGDILIWHADLAHGGARITHHKSRRSLVTHYCPLAVKPNYRERTLENYFELRHKSGHFFASRHYGLEPLARGGRARVYYDGGVRARSA